MESWGCTLAIASISIVLLATCSKNPNQTEKSSSANWLKTSEIDLDQRVACADLNRYVNAQWLTGNPVPADQTRWGTFQILHEQSLHNQRSIAEAAAKYVGRAKRGSPESLVGLLYAAGMDEAAIERAGFEPIKPELEAIAKLRDTPSIVRYLTDTFARGEGQVFHLYRDADYKNAAVQIAYVSQGGLGLPTPDYYTKTHYAELRAAYIAYIARLLQQAGIEAHAAHRQAEQTLAFETRLARASLAPVELRDPAHQYHFVRIAEANALTPRLNWRTFFQAQGVSLKKGFSLSPPKFFAEVNAMLADTPVEHWQAYLRFHTLKDAAPYLSSAFQKENFAFYGKMLNGQQAMAPRWKRVLNAVNGQLGMALGQLYVAQHFSAADKKQAQALVDNLGAALRLRIEKLNWMSDVTKKSALEKWRTFLPKIGYPDQWRDWSRLNLKAGDYFGNLQAAAQFNHAYEMSKVGQPTDRTEWDMTPQTVNAYYNPTGNTLHFPAAILQPPFFYAQADPALNYGGIGAVIGHEMTHAYDDQGSRFDAHGNQMNWWTATDRRAFNAHTSALVEQFNAYSPLPGLFVNGALTLGENIADLGGLATAYDALHNLLDKKPALAKLKIEGYTQNQRFFINWARVWRQHIRPEALKVQLDTDPHAPAQYRAIGAPSNLPHFAEAFSCKAEDPMVRTGNAQVKIW